MSSRKVLVRHVSSLRCDELPVDRGNDLGRGNSVELNFTLPLAGLTGPVHSGLVGVSPQAGQDDPQTVFELYPVLGLLHHSRVLCTADA